MTVIRYLDDDRNPRITTAPISVWVEQGSILYLKESGADRPTRLAQACDWGERSTPEARASVRLGLSLICDALASGRPVVDITEILVDAIGQRQAKSER